MAYGQNVPICDPLKEKHHVYFYLDLICILVLKQIRQGSYKVAK